MTLPLDRGAVRALPNARAVARHDAAVWDLRSRRDRAVADCPDFAALRDHAAAIKAHTLDHLDEYLERFEREATRAGARVWYAGDADALCRRVLDLLVERGARRVVKSKSMLTEECGLNPFLERHGISVVDTDLGERIVQLMHQPPSHIMTPAIHVTREEIGALFHRELGSPEGETDPERLVGHARAHMRRDFLAAEAGITGGNFALADSGSVVVVTNEGNADLGTSLPPLHIACVGIEKVIPSLDDLAVFMRLLPRSATGQISSAYTTLFRGPRDGGELHIVLVDNGRTQLLADSVHRTSLGCIRCGACLNTCPVYRRAGGHAYGSTIPGPIGSVLAPVLETGESARTLPLASSLCGSCTEVCPVRIDLHAQLLAWRRERPATPQRLRWAAKVAAALLARPRLYRLAGRVLARVWPLLQRRWPGNPAGSWLAARQLPPHPGESFRTRYLRRAAPPEKRR